MKKIFENHYFLFTIRLLLGGVMIYASIHKIQYPIAFSDNIDNFYISPIEINNIVALVLPWIELLVGICLITGIFLEGASLINFGIYIFFIFILLQAVLRGIDTHCGCFKSSYNEGLESFKFKLIQQIILDLVMAIASWIVYKSSKSFKIK